MKEYYYEVDLSWKSKLACSLNSHGLQEIKVVSPIETPTENKNEWTPEQLLAASVSSCFMTTFLEIAEKSKLDIITYKSQCFVKLEKIKSKFITKEILIRPTIKLSNEQSMLKAYKCIEDAETACPVRNSLTINIEVHPLFEYIGQEKKMKTE